MVSTLPAALYRTPAAWRLERSAVFGESWWAIGHEGSVPESGDVVAFTAAGWPLLLLRDELGEVRAFHNVCRHRAAPLVWDGDRTRQRVLQCRYHGWRYSLDGRLQRAPNHGAEPSCDGLFEVPLRCWRGVLFACVRPPEPEPRPLPDFAPFVDTLERVCSADWNGFRVVGHAAHELHCNWKTYVENYLEGWHIPYVHPELSKEVDVRCYEVRSHEPGVVTHHVPARSGAVSEGFWAWIWPSTALNVYADGMSLECMVPVGHERTRIAYTYLAAPGADFARSQAMSGSVTAEDVRICEAVQRNLDAGAYQTGELSPRHEGGLAWFQDRLRALHGGPDEERRDTAGGQEEAT